MLSNKALPFEATYQLLLLNNLIYHIGAIIYCYTISYPQKMEPRQGVLAANREDMKEILAKILEALTRIEDALGDLYCVESEIRDILRGSREKAGEYLEAMKVLDVVTLLELPDHLRKTAVALSKLGEARAQDVAEITGRERAVESSYLNQLARLGYVKKIRRKHEVWFKLA